METEREKVEFIKTERSSFNDFKKHKKYSVDPNKLSINEATNHLIPNDVFKFNRFIIQNSQRSTDR
jgi:hypothetical protein